MKGRHAGLPVRPYQGAIPFHHRPSGQWEKSGRSEDRDEGEDRTGKPACLPLSVFAPELVTIFSHLLSKPASIREIRLQFGVFANGDEIADPC